MDGNTPGAIKIKLRIGDKLLSEGSGGVFDHVNPANGQVQAQVPMAGPAEVNAAVEAAAEAFEIWRKWPGTRRRDVLLKLADLVQARAGDFGVRAAMDIGTPIAMGGAGPNLFGNWTRYYAGWADKLDGSVAGSFERDGEFSYSLAEPYGVIGIIITWNGPLISIGMKVSPALAAGNTVVIKPSEMTPFAADLFGQLVKEAGIPDGVVNIVTGGVDAGEALVRHPKVEKISFTGGPTAARKIMALCAEQLKPSLHELGGKSANLIFPDANLEAAMGFGATFPLQILSGQGCALPTRMLVHESIYAQAQAVATGVAKGIRLGDPMDPETAMGPVVNEAAANRIVGMVEKAKSSGAGKLLTGGARAGGALKDGFYIEPTVFADVDNKSEIAQTEVFGPVLSIIPFKTEDDAIALANDTAYGLAAFLQTRDVQRVHRLSERLRAGAIYVNGGTTIWPSTPFGGLGLSGFGREGGRQGIDEFLRPKTIQIGSMS
jgi:aldehyde dehydrogenase (NAD+)